MNAPTSRSGQTFPPARGWRSSGGPGALLQNHFVMSASKCFFIAAVITDIICMI
jgi:hypothetical protein